MLHMEMVLWATRPGTPNRWLVSIGMGLLILAALGMLLRRFSFGRLDPVAVLATVVAVALAGVFTRLPGISDIGESLYRAVIGASETSEAVQNSTWDWPTMIGMILAIAGVVVFYRSYRKHKDQADGRIKAVLGPLIFMTFALWWLFSTGVVNEAVTNYVDFTVWLWNQLPGVAPPA